MDHRVYVPQKPMTRFTMLFELAEDNQLAPHVTRPTVGHLESSTLGQIAIRVASSGQTLNIADLSDWLKRHPEVGGSDSENVKAVLCMPIVDGSKNIIGVTQLIDKVSGIILRRNRYRWLFSITLPQDNKLQFTDSDVSILEAFAIFCGLGIHNTQMYESACKLMAKQKVALECLSYHATATQSQTEDLIKDHIPSAEAYTLYSFTFNGEK